MLVLQQYMRDFRRMPPIIVLLGKEYVLGIVDSSYWFELVT